MPAALSYPGVYVEEIPSGVRTVTGVATSITAFVGRTLRGPVNEPKVIHGYGDFERHFGGLSLDSPLSFAVRDFFLNGGGQAIIVRLHHGAGSAQFTVPTTSGNLILEAANPGTWGNSLRVSVDHDTKDPSDTNLFNLSVVTPLEDGKFQVLEKFLNLSIDPNSPRYYETVLEQNSHLLRVHTLPGTSSRPNETVASGEQAPLTPSTPGTDGDALSENDFTGDGMAGNKQGLYALEKADLFNLLCLPPHTLEGDIEDSLLSKAAKYCEDRRAFLLVDPPSSWGSVEDAVEGFGDDITVLSKNAAVYFPRLVQPNPLRENQLETFVPCGAVAGVIARTDTQRGIWKAPAGLDALLNGVPKLSVSLTDKENGQLNPLGVNCLRALPAAGRVVWGARTTRGNDLLADEWKYIPVRRLALYIEESLYRGIQWVVFEPNDEPLWSQIRLNVGAFMQNLFRQGAFQGKSPREAFFVKCDKESTTQDDINRGVVNIHVGFAPLKPAEFVVLKLQQMAGQIEA